MEADLVHQVIRFNRRRVVQSCLFSVALAALCIWQAAITEPNAFGVWRIVVFAGIGAVFGLLGAHNARLFVSNPVALDLSKGELSGYYLPAPVPWSSVAGAHALVQGRNAVVAVSMVDGQSYHDQFSPWVRLWYGISGDVYQLRIPARILDRSAHEVVDLIDACLHPQQGLDQR